MGRFYYYDMIYTIDEGWMVKVFTKTGKPVWESSVYDDRNECLVAMIRVCGSEANLIRRTSPSQPLL